MQKDILSETEQAIEEQEKKIQKAEKGVSRREKVIEKQDVLIVENNAAIMEKHSAPEDVTMKLADMEMLVDEAAGQTYEKACEVVTDTVRQKTEGRKLLDMMSEAGADRADAFLEGRPYAPGEGGTAGRKGTGEVSSPAG